MTVDEPESPFWRAARGEVLPPPAGQLLGWTVLEAEPGSGKVVVRFEATEQFTNPIGNIQGGFIAAMLDDAMGPACATTFEPDEFGSTLELKVNYIRAAKPGTYIGTGTVVHRGKSIAFIEAELRTADGELVATATSTMRVARVDPDRFWTSA